MDIIVEGVQYTAPEYTKCIVEDMQGNLQAIDCVNPDMYEIGFARPGRVRRFKRRIDFKELTNT